MSTLISINSTYPLASWDTAHCKEFDHSINSSAIITTQWQISKSPPIKRVCGYVNGYLNDEFSTSEILSGAQTYFLDLTPASSSYLNKRVYCIAVEYCSPGSSNINFLCYSPCPAGTSPSSTNAVLCSPGNAHRNISTTTMSYQCAVGLIYDGTPIDLTPRLGKHGVTFSFIDTSSSESRFDIYVGEVGGDDATKSNVVTIPSSLSGCGRTASPISFTDQLSTMSVGQIMEYAITATQSYFRGNGTIVSPTEMFKFPYRIPFLVNIDGNVNYKGGGGVESVKVSICHIDRSTQLPDTNSQYCPLVTWVTDAFGHFSGEIRVSDP